MSKVGFNSILAVIVVLALVAFNSLFVIKEGNVGIVTRFADIVRNSYAKFNAY